MKHTNPLLQIAVIVLALPFIIPAELYYRARYPSVRWTVYPAGYEVHRARRGLPTKTGIGRR